MIHALIPLLFEFDPDEAESVLATAAKLEPQAAPTAAELVEAADHLRRDNHFVMAERLYLTALGLVVDEQEGLNARMAAYSGLGCIQMYRGQLIMAAVPSYFRAMSLRAATPRT